MSTESSIQFVILAVLDGWGIAPKNQGNAISLANIPNMRRFELMYPHTQLGASGDSVGLPRGEVGNTETGHLNLGAGRIIYQDLARINMSIADGSFFNNSTLIKAIDHAKKNNSNLHLMGLIGAGGVHSNIEHLFALIQLAKRQSFSRVFLHLFTDGRDSPPTSALIYVNQINDAIKNAQVGQIASISGRYWAMDRDMRWDRTQRAYFALTEGKAPLGTSAEAIIKQSYAKNITDEFIEPSLILKPGTAEPLSLIKNNDAVIFFNFRIDRPRQLTKAFVLDDFSKAAMDTSFDPHQVNYQKTHLAIAKPETTLFERGKKLANLYFVTMTEYSKTISTAGAQIAFPPENVTMPLGRVISEHDLSQLRVSESEKERFVTFYFNGQNPIVFPKEEHLIVPSPRVPTYDQMPEMSARIMTDTLLAKLQSHPNYAFILINFANPDMVGHTGNLQAAIKACEVVDECVGKLEKLALNANGALLITADHGNAEEMIKEDSGDIDTEHSKNPVPFIAVARKFENKGITLPSGILADIAPTILSLLNIPSPINMMGKDLLTSVREGF